MRYDAVFLDVDKTLLWVDVDVEGYVEDLAPYAENGSLTVEKARGPLLKSLQKHINENINYPTEEELVEMGLPLYAVSNWDVALEGVIEDLGWSRYFSGIVASAKVGSEKPARDIFEETLRVAGVSPKRAVHVGNDPVSDVRGASSCGIDAVLIDREGNLDAPEATVTLPDLRGLPALVRG